MKKSFNQKGITLVALVITIIILLILAGITISQLTGSGLFENAKLAEQKSKEAQEKEETTLADYENKIGEYVNNDRETGNGISKQVLWTGEQSSGTISLSDSIYNYDFLSVTTAVGTAIVDIDRNGMTEIFGGAIFANRASNGGGTWGFYVSAISDDGKTLTLTRCGSVSTSWTSYYIIKITGIR